MIKLGSNSFSGINNCTFATVGLGNIAGVAIAIGTGGPGATLDDLVGFIGMSSNLQNVHWDKFIEKSEKMEQSWEERYIYPKD